MFKRIYLPTPVYQLFPWLFIFTGLAAMFWSNLNFSLVLLGMIIAGYGTLIIEIRLCRCRN